jgi:pimeloyl-ACP methyl ester carboxylesterase
MDKKVIIVLHGWGQSIKDWYIIKSMFSDNFIAINLPGFGREPLVSKNFTIPDYANWVIEKISKIEGQKILLGHSFGGRVASYISSQKPELLKGLILYGAPCIYRPSFKVKLKIFINKLKNKLGIKKNIFKNTEMQKAKEDGLDIIFKNAVNFDQTDNLKNIKTKTLLLWGEKDQSVPLKIAREIEKLIPKSKLVIMEKLGHNAHKENPYLFYGIIKKFIENI